MKQILRLSALVVVLLMGGIIVADKVGGGGHPATPAVAAESGMPPSWVVALARETASSMGVPHPTSALVVRTTRQAAAAVESSSKVDSNGPTYYVVLQGEFADMHAHTPDGRTIYGTVLTLNMDIASQHILDLGLFYKVPNIAKLGPVTDFTDQM